MSYVGRGIENLADRVVLDALTASATADYTLQLNSTNFIPSSASALTVSLNGVIQKPESSYTVAGAVLSFSSALTSSDSIDFIIAVVACRLNKECKKKLTVAKPTKVKNQLYPLSEYI